MPQYVTDHSCLFNNSDRNLRPSPGDFFDKGLHIYVMSSLHREFRRRSGKFYFIREAHLHDVATKKFLLGEHDQPSSHDKRQPVPLGMAWISEDKLSESYNVNAKQMSHLLSLGDM